MSRPTSAFVSLLTLLATGCPAEWDPHSTNTPPEATLDGTPTTVTRGEVATFDGTVSDAQQGSGDLTVAWSFEDRNGAALSVETFEDCTLGPQDSATLKGRVACTVRVPVDQDSMTVVLVPADSRMSGDAASLDVAIDAGQSPACTLSRPAPTPPTGAYFADEPLEVDGTCADAAGETGPSDLDLWFRATWLDEQGQTVSEEFRPSGGDTAALDLTVETSGNEARLFGTLFLQAAGHELCLFAEDEASNRNGNDACVDLTVEPPNTAPWCEILLPLDGTTGNVGDEVHFEGWVGDDEQDPATLAVHWRSNQLADPIGYGTPSSDGRVSIDTAIAFTEPATHEITLVVDDVWGERCTDSIRYTVGDGPSVHIDAPLDGDVLDIAEAIPFEATFSDSQTDCDALELSWESSLLEDPLFSGPPESGICTDIFLYDPDDPELQGPLPEGSHVIYLYVLDENGNLNADMITIEVGDCTRDWYQDLDADGYGDDTVLVQDCTQPTGYVAIPGDCEDSNSTINPAAIEQCNALDDNCDGTVDEGFHVVTFYRDADGDGYGDSADPYPDPVCSTATLPGYAPLGGDCDDTQPDINPGEAELCDDTDHDCDGSIDNGLIYPYGTILYLDADGDGYGASSTTSCAPLTGWVLTGGDCDDTDATVHPAATEVCDATPVDNDCDGDADPFDASGCVVQYLDADGDGYGTSAGTNECVCLSNPGDYTATNTGDCDDANYSINPGVDEVCDAAGTDEDCDGYSETEDALGCSPYYYDADGDNYYASGAASRCLCAEDGDYRGHIAGDCDDSDAAINPSAAEICDGVDNDCDGLIDDDDGSVSGGSTWYRDADSDGYGLATATIERCGMPSGYVADSTDCDDSSAGVHPSATEICDASDTDEDCNGVADDSDSGATGETTWYRDADSDTYGTSSTTLSRCDQPSGYVSRGSDCDDSDSSINPGATEVCDASDTDEDCDGVADDSDSSATGKSTWYRDADSDTYGTSSTTLSRCNQPSGYVSNSSDCDDSSASINPAATEICDASDTDEDCNGVADDSDSGATGKSTWYRDADSDTYGTSSTTVSRCNQPSGYVSRGSDCDDSSASINPGATEICDTSDTDENCNGVADDSDSTTSSSSKYTWYRDADSDTYGTSSTTVSRCNQPSGYVSRASDCNDSYRYAFPGAAERESSSSCREDADADGYGDSSPPSGVTAGGDCNDSNSSINPGATEVCDASDTDEDCDGLADDYDSYASGKSTWYRDADSDTYGISTTSVSRCNQPSGYVSNSSDCNDGYAWIAPGLQMHTLVEVYSPTRQDHMTTVDGGDEYTLVTTSSGYDYYDATPRVVGYSIASFPSGYSTSSISSNFDLIHRGWSSVCADHVTCVSVSTVNASAEYSGGCSYTADSLNLGYLPDSDKGSLTRHWTRCFRDDRNNHRMTYDSSHTCDDIASAYDDNGSVRWVFTSDISCP